MDEDQWMYERIMPEEVDMDDENEEECGVNEPHVDWKKVSKLCNEVLDGRW